MSAGKTPLPFPTGATTRATLRLAQATVLWEALWPAFVPALAILGLFVALAGLDVLPDLPGWGHAVILAALAGAAIASLAWGLRRVRWPRRRAALRRIETGAGLAHRPLEAVEDKLAAGVGDSSAEALWRAHMARMAAAARGARIGLPRPGMAKRDPWAFRSFAVLALALALPGLWSDGADRLYRAVVPDFSGGAAAEVAIDVWLQPPEYTGLSPIYLQPRAEQTVVQIPTGSTLLSRVHGGRGTPRLELSGATTTFTKIETGEYEARVTVTEGERLAIRQGPREIAVWPIAVIADTAPEIAFLGAPSGTAQSTLRVDFEARDDYGVAKGELVLRRAGAEDGEAIAVPLPIHGAANARDSAYLDLTSHVWAGLAVVGQMTASDAIGQTGSSAKLTFVLPERRFTNPIARAIIEQRKRLILNPGERDSVALALDVITQRVIERVKDGVLVLGLASARGRLVHDKTPSGVKETIPLLWDLALRAEDGDLSLAARDLRALEDKLAEALERGASEAELDKLFAELRQALDRYMQALMEQLEQRMKAGEQPERVNRDDLSVGAQDLQKLIEEARQLMRAGARDLARQLLSQLRNVLENMRAGVAEQGRQQNNVGAQMMNELRALTERQQGLMDQLFRQFQEGRRPGQSRSQGPQPGQPTSPENLSAAEQQAQIRQALEAFSKKLQGLLGQPPGQMGEAGRAMERAIDSFTGNQTARGVEQQGEALEALRQAGRTMAQQLMERFQGSGTEGAMDGRSRGQGRDGIGRPTGGGFGAATEDIGIPDENEIRKAREILDELRRRAGDRNRPPIERQYLDRLLPRF